MDDAFFAEVVRSLASCRAARRSVRASNLEVVKDLRSASCADDEEAWTKRVRTARKRLRASFETFFASVSGMTKLLRRGDDVFASTPAPRAIMDKIALFWLADHDMVDAARVLQLECDGTLEDVSLEMLEVLKGTSGDLAKMLAWAARHVPNSELRFRLLTLQYQSLETPEEMVRFARLHITPQFGESHRAQVSRLLLDTLVEPASRTPILLDDIVAQFDRVFRATHGLPPPGNVIRELIEAGDGLVRTAEGELHAPNASPRHSVFVCPVSREVGDVPLLLQCGHVLGLKAYERMTVRGRVSCPAQCSESTAASSVVRLHL